MPKKSPYLKIYKSIKVDPEVWFKLHDEKLKYKLDSVNAVLRRKMKMGEYE